MGKRPPAYSCKIVNVGLVTGALLPNPATRPLTNCVFPEPSSPFSASTDPGPTRLANRRPNASVSAGLFEMNVATGQFSIFDLRSSIEVTNLRQQELGKFRRHLICKRSLSRG